MRVLAIVFGVGTLLTGAPCCPAQERAAIEPVLPGFEFTVTENPRIALTTTAESKSASHRKHDRQRTTKMAPPVVQSETHPWSTTTSSMATLRKRFRLEKKENSFHREVKLHLVGIGPVQIAAFEARRSEGKLQVAVPCMRDCAGEGALRLVYRAQPPRRSFGFTLAFRWN